MEQDEILMMFRLSRNKREQIRILAELTDSDEETIIEVLRDNGEYVTLQKCRKCHRLFQKYLSPYCPDCEEIIQKQRTEEQRYKTWLRWQMKEIAVRKKALSRQISELNKQTEKLREELDG